MLFVFDVPARGSWRVRAALRALVSPSPGPGAGPGLRERARMSGAEKGLGAWADPGAGGVIEGWNLLRREEGSEVGPLGNLFH